jgi:hypothetical protein
MSTLTPREQLDIFIDRYSDDVAAAMRQALRHLRRRVPGATELVYDNYNALGVGFGPTDRPSGIVLSVVAYPRWVSLFFLQSGARLPDPRKLLKGSGSRVRHIVLTSPEVIASAEVGALIGHALDAAKDAIDPARKRLLVIKSVSARQRPRQAKRKTSRNGGVDYETVRALALAMPEVIDSSTVFYLTPHYLVNASVLVRLKHVSRKTLEAVLELAWQFVTAESTAGKGKPGQRR